MENNIQGDIAKGLKPFVELFDTPQGVYLQGQPNIPADKFFTGIIVLISHMVENGHSLDDMIHQIKMYVSQQAVEKVIQ